MSIFSLTLVFSLLVAGRVATAQISYSDYDSPEASWGGNVELKRLRDHAVVYARASAGSQTFDSAFFPIVDDFAQLNMKGCTSRCVVFLSRGGFAPPKCSFVLLTLRVWVGFVFLVCF
jgi:hypothetical protein